METSSSNSLSIESFSYSWLANLKPSLLDSLESSLRTSLDASDEASFIEMDPRMPPSKRFFRRPSSQDFKFDFPASPSTPLGLVRHADELISGGYLVPLFLDHISAADHDDEASDDSRVAQNSLSSNTTTTTTTSDSSVRDAQAAAGNSDCSSLRRCRRVSKRILQKYLNFLRPLYRRIRGGGGHNKASHHHHHHHHGEKRVHQVVGKSRVYSSETASPRISVAYSTPDEFCWRKSCDSDSSIYEAVLHCKRSIGN